MGEASTAPSVQLFGVLHVRTAAGMSTPPRMLGDTIKAVAVRGPLHVEQLIDLLWPDDATETGRHRVRNVLSRLRRVVGPVLTRVDEIIDLAPGVAVDAHRFEADARTLLSRSEWDERCAASAAETLLIYGEGLLPYDRYLDWVAGPRERLRGLHLGLLDALALHAEATDRMQEAVWHRERGIEADPYEEARYVELANLLVRLDRPGAARRVVARGVAAFAELGVAPTVLQPAPQRVSA
jgi:DNA-binding SARP family transcriptional activator